ncbi:MAG: hypothetical protein HY909_29970 [Deltaproteobacteria bacterium]|nr:hypothetical protein [Deltaproteobacteria bacterium]
MPAQLTCPGGHVDTQLPPEQTWPERQVRPHIPQLPGSLPVLVSQPLAATPSQSPKPALQAPTAQRPAAQDAVAFAREHTRPQAPQCIADVCTLVSQPVEAIRSQSPKPEAQLCAMHVPARHAAVEVLASAQRVPHIPQLPGSLSVLAQYAPGPAPQVASGAAQLAAQAPDAHTCPAAQRIEQRPQLPRSDSVLTSQPSTGIPLQSAKPGRQLPTLHTPARHDAVPFGGAQARPQPPQCASLVRVSVSQPLVATPSQSA